jgi:hypothetical protein
MCSGSKRKYELKEAIRAKEYQAACGSMSLRGLPELKETV